MANKAVKVTKIPSKKLVIIQQSKTQNTELIETIQVEGNTKYQIFNKDDQLVKNPKTKLVNEDLWVYLEGNNSQIPDVILKDYTTSFPINNAEYLSSANSTFATAENLANNVAQATQISNPASTGALEGSWIASNIGVIGAGVLGVGGVIALASGGSDDDKASDNQSPKPTPTPVKLTTSVSLDPIDTVNQQASNGKVTLTGKLTVSDTSATTEVILTINGATYKAQVTGSTWSVVVDGKELAFAQGNQAITANITAKTAEQTATNNAQATYLVDTDIAKPEIIFDKITEDNIINLVESKQTTTKVSGKVKNANNGDEIVIQVGNNPYKTQVQNGLFTIDVKTSDLVVNKSVSAGISTQDTAGNTAQGIATHAYAVDVTPPVTPPMPTPVKLTTSVSLDPIDTVNQQASNGKVTLTGKLTVSDTSATTEVILTINGATYKAQVTGSTWSVVVDGKELAFAQGNQAITANITAKTAEQTATNNAQATYLVDTDIAKPEIIFDKITEDNIINLVESKQTTTKVSGKVKNANNGDEIVITIGQATYKATVNNDTFSTDVDTKTLLSHGNVTATISTQDIAGNVASDTESHNYTVDLGVLEKPVITIDNITADNIVNKKESEGKLTVTGKVDNVAVGKMIVVSCGCATCGGLKWIDFETTIKEGGKFAVDFNGADIVKADTIKAVVKVEDNAKNTYEATETKSYTTDVTPPNADLTLNQVGGDNLLNKADMAQVTTTIKGTLHNLADGDSVKTLTLFVNGQSYQAKVTGNQYEATVNTTDLAKGTKVIANAIVVDKAGNEQTLSKEQIYQIDNIAPTATINIKTIAQDNTLNLNELMINVEIVGQVIGEFNVNDVVKIQIGTNSYDANITNTNGDFSVQVPASVLQQNTSKSITATLTTTDNAGNVSELITATRDYEIETAPIIKGEIFVELTSIANDNLINVTEAQKDVTVTGVVTGKDRLATGQTVDLLLNGKVVKTVDVGADGKFSTMLSGSELVNGQNYILTANVKGSNNAQNTGSLQYKVDANTAAKIDIQLIDNDFGLDKADTNGTIRLYGKATFEGEYANANNAKLVRQLEAKIGDKTYTVGVRDGAFFLDIDEKDLKALDGKAIEYTFKAETWRYNSNGEAYLIGNNSNNTTYNIDVKATQVSFDANPYIKTSGTTTSIAYTENTTNVTGIVSGTAKVDDVIELNINGSLVTTKVLADNKFSVNVATDLLKQDADNIITATLKTKDLANNDIKVSDTEHLFIAKDTTKAGDFVSRHTERDGVPDDYFVRDIGHTKYLSQGYTIPSYKIPVGGKADNSTPVVKFYFANKNDYDTHLTDPKISSARGEIIEATVATYTEEIKQIIREAYKQIGDYINVKFEEVYRFDEADARLFYADFPSQGTLAFASNSGDLWWNARANTDDKADMYYTALHEISHTLNMTHSQDTFKDYFRNMEETPEFTYMSYRAYVNNYAFKNMKNLRVYDLAYLHYQFGVSKTARATDDTYTFKEYDMYSDDADRYIWDGAGIDTFDASKEKDKVTVDLTPGSWIYVGNKSTNLLVDKQTLHKDVADKQGYYSRTDDGFYNSAVTNNTYTKGQAYIGYGTQIENLIGSDYDDTLTGNNANNIISGGAGNDTISGGLGDDHLDGGIGDDKLIGGTGNDTYVVDSVNDTITELKDEGNDNVFSTVNLTLTDNVENLWLLGTTATVATGNALANTLIANNVGNTLSGLDGDDKLIGGLGADTLIGGKGNDTFVFDSALNGTIDTITDFMKDGVDKIELSANVFKGLVRGNNSNVLDFIKYDKNTGILSYDSDKAEGIADAIDFANIGKGLDIDKNLFTII